jgi:hypothetical protein
LIARPNNKPKREINGISVIIASVIFVLGAYVVITKPSFFCGELNEIEIGDDKSAWQIGSSSINAEIVWQKNTIPGLGVYGAPNSKVAVSATHTAIGRGSVNSICDGGHDVVAFRNSDGKRVWSFAADLIHWIEPTDQGFFVLYGDTQVTKIEDTGHQSLYLPQLPSRSARMLYVTSDYLYFPIASYSYRLSIKEKFIESVEDTVVLGTIDNLLVVHDGDYRIKLKESISGRDILTVALSESNPLNKVVQNIKQNIHLDHYQDIFFIYYGSQITHRIEAYELHSGKLLWHLDKRFNSVPVIVNESIVAIDSDNVLTFFNVQNGNVKGNIQLVRTGDEENPTSDFSVWISGNKSVVVILFQNTSDLISLKLAENSGI